MRSRFAPSTTGEAHPGTLLSALLVVLDARVRGLRTLVRYEDLDPQRCRPQHLERMQQDLQWLGLTFDHACVQSTEARRHREALRQLANRGRLYRCSTSRKEIVASAQKAPDGSPVYDNRNRNFSLAPEEIDACDEPLRVRLDDGPIRLRDGSGVTIEHDPREFGDPIVRRRDGSVAYQLASVVDDTSMQVTRVVRGVDLLPSTVLQIALQRVLEFPTPEYFHHPLLLERRDRKLSKLHGAVGVRVLRQRYEPEELVGVLLHAVGLIDAPRSVDLNAIEVDWSRLVAHNVVVDVGGDGTLRVEIE